MLRAMPESQVELLKRVPLFSDLDDRELKQLAASMKERTFASGDAVTEEGKGGVGFFVIADGKAKVSVGGSEVRTLGAGDYFGEIGPVFGLPRSATVRARTDAAVIGYSVPAFRQLLGAAAGPGLNEGRELALD